MSRFRLSRLCAIVAPVLALTVSSAHAALVAYYPLDVNNAGVTPDVVGGNNATLQNGASITASAAPGGGTGSLLLDGVNDQATAFGYTGVTGTSARTFMAWINTATAIDDAILSWGTNSTGQKWVVRINDNAGNGTVGGIRVEVNGGFRIGSQNLVDGNWHHVVGVLVDDGSPNANEIIFYVDGKRIGMTGQATAINTASAANVIIGNDPLTNNTRQFPGMIDEVRLYDHAARSSEVSLVLTGKALPLATFSYNASNDTSANGLWDDEIQAFDVPERDYNLTTQSRVSIVGNKNMTHAYRFNGDGPIATTDANPETFLSNTTGASASFEMWFRPTDLVGQEVLWEWGGNTDGTSLTLDGSNVQFVVRDGSHDTATLAADISGLAGMIQVVGVADLDNDRVDLYVNGVLMASDLSFTGLDWAGSNAIGLGGQNLELGGNLAGYGAFFGDIAIARFYNEALNATEVRALFLENNYIPEPATMSLLLLAGGALGRRRRQAIGI